MPLHIAIIPDGNRRWARQRLLHPWDGHRKAIENFRAITEYCRNDSRIGILTVWCFSTENWKRDPKEVSALMGFLEDYLAKERETFIKNHTRFLHSGRKDRIPRTLATLIEDVEQETKNETGFTLHLAVDYGGMDEMIRAVRKACEVDEASEVDEAAIRKHLDHPELPDIDLVIRTSGEMRTSNFFLWQSAYAEWFFIDTFFPDFGVPDLASCIREFEERQRRYGA